MGQLAPSVAAIRVAVRRSLAECRSGDTVLVACSGGADSLALADAARFEAGRRGLHCGLVTVDHGLQAGSADRAAELVDWAKEQGFAPVVASVVLVSGRPGGPEAAARDARYEALFEAARLHRASAVLLGHTRDDQAETVLLALARGAGPRGLAGMPAATTRDGVRLLRPLLDVSRADTRTACAERGRQPWDDPHNSDPAYARSRVRAALPVLVDLLGDDVVDNLARTARLIAADTAVLDALAAAAGTVDDDGALDLDGLEELPSAVRTRVLRLWATGLGGGALTHRHIEALDALVTDWHGQGPTALPGGVEVVRRGRRLAVAGKTRAGKVSP
jgi:tRNA(Ile)-lysidine synthase